VVIEEGNAGEKDAIVWGVSRGEGIVSEEALGRACMKEETSF